jgi:hypothetical protein
MLPCAPPAGLLVFDAARRNRGDAPSRAFTHSQGSFPAITQARSRSLLPYPSPARPVTCPLYVPQRSGIKCYVGCSAPSLWRRMMRLRGEAEAERRVTPHPPDADETPRAPDWRVSKQAPPVSTRSWKWSFVSRHQNRIRNVGRRVSTSPENYPPRYGCRRWCCRRSGKRRRVRRSYTAQA